MALLRGLNGVRVTHGSARVESFYGYDGSLTTPPCTEGVRWSVLAHGGRVSREAVTRFHELIARFPDYGGYADNNRPLQPLNGRVVTLRRDGGRSRRHGKTTQAGRVRGAPRRTRSATEQPPTEHRLRR